ncbi:MAG: Hsp20/alpha crystallin family protein, partial [Candidatus Latescibacterota bacterium]
MAYVVVTPRTRAADVYSHPEECWSPAVDIMEKDASYAITIDMPGFEKDDFKIMVQDDILTVSAERPRQEPENEDYYRYFERPAGKISRSFRLPDVVDAQNIKAT